jgi:site-specific DNA recombinase
MTKPIVHKRRCAIYTRKSSDEGLEQEFNSLDAQREACGNFVASQRAEGWFALDHRYDDGGFSGGTLDRPALKRLIDDIEASAVDIVVVYKIDRLSRSLMDFAKLVEILERNNVTFVSVTQAFSTTTSMGRLTLNILLSFAQFERELSGERIRDKIAASRKRGIWMGGWAPFGYQVKDRKLVISEADAKVVRSIFDRFITLRSATLHARELQTKGVRNRYGRLLDKGSIYKLLSNRVYIGEAVHKGTAYPGEHEAIIDRRTWDRAHAILQESPRKRATTARASTPAPLKGLIFDSNGNAMSPTHTRRRGKQYRYYVSQAVLKAKTEATAAMRVPAGEIEQIVVGHIRRLLAQPEMIVATWKQLKRSGNPLAERQVRDALLSFDKLWVDLFPAEQTRIVQLLVDKVVVAPDRADIHLRIDGFSSLVQEITPAEAIKTARAA